jgi:hypothetical protein
MLVELTKEAEPKERSIKYMLGKKEYKNKFEIWLCFRAANFHVSMFADVRKKIDHLALASTEHLEI